MTIPLKTAAAVYNEREKKLEIKEIPIPIVYDDEILVESKAGSVNAVDSYHMDFGWAPDGSVLGISVSGVVLFVGKDVTRFKPGDFITSFIHGGDYTSPKKGGYSKYAVVQEIYSIKLNKLEFDELTYITSGQVKSFQGAASIPDTTITLGISLYHTFRGSFEQKQDKTLLVYGGSTASGLIATSIAKLFGWTVISIASKKHKELIRQFGGDYLVDYHDSDVKEQVEKIDPNITLALHTVGGVPSLQLVNDIVSETENVKIDSLVVPNLNDIKNAKSNVEFTMTRAFTGNGRDVVYNNGSKFSASPGSRESLFEFVPIVEKLFNDGVLRHIPIKIHDGSLELLNEALDDIKQGKISGEKLVINF